MLNSIGRRICAILVLWASSTAAEMLPPMHVEVPSAILQQLRGIDVYLPQETRSQPTLRCETLYVLDGNWNAKLVAETVDFLHAVGYLPPIIVVGIPNHFENGVDSRDHDLTPTAVGGKAHSGGAADFLKFLKTELIPYVDGHYPSNGINLIHGHSYGGLFLAYVLATDPSAFGGYILLDPAMWWDDHKLAQQLADKVAAVPAKSTAIFVGGRSGEAWSGMAVDRVQTAFEQHAPAQLAWKVMQYRNENHDSMKYKATYDALRFVFTGYDAQSVGVDTPYGIVVKGQPVPLQAQTDRFDIRYTTDGSEPDRASPQLSFLMAVSDPTHMRLKSLSARGEFDHEIALHLTLGDWISSDKNATADPHGIFSYAYFEPSAWPSLRGKPFATGRANDLDKDRVGKPEVAGYVAHNYTIAADGYYLVVLGTSGKARLRIDGKLLLDLSSPDKMMYRPFIVPLRAGVHRLRLEFLRKKDGGADFEFLRFDATKGWSGNVD